MVIMLCDHQDADDVRKLFDEEGFMIETMMMIMMSVLLVKMRSTIMMIESYIIDLND
jgi:hypothetical protein